MAELGKLGFITSFRGSEKATFSHFWEQCSDKNDLSSIYFLPLKDF